MSRAQALPSLLVCAKKSTDNVSRSHGRSSPQRPGIVCQPQEGRDSSSNHTRCHRTGWEKTKAAATDPKPRLSGNRVLGTAIEPKFRRAWRGKRLPTAPAPAHLHFHDRHEVLPLLLQIEGRLGLGEERGQQAGLDARGPALAGHGFAQGGDIRSWELTT